VSTLLYGSSRLVRDHLLEIGAHGFETIEVLAARTHLDYHSPAAVADLRGWLGEAGLTLHSVHAPSGEGYAAGRWTMPLSLASTDRGVRERAVAEAAEALQIARQIAFSVLVVHLGVPRWSATAAVDNSRDAARRSVEALQALAEPLGVRVAVEICPNELSRAGPLVHFVERVVDAAGVGICLDTGHAHLDGNLVDAIETASEHLLAVDVHDNQKRADEHRVPLDGTIEWPAALTTLEKVGYEGPLMFELAPRGPTRETLSRARRARQRMEGWLAR
jgi:sugar phosphate isomerase/epimerase